LAPHPPFFPISSLLLPFFRSCFLHLFFLPLPFLLPSFLHRYRVLRYRLPFPTRRSSDLERCFLRHCFLLHCSPHCHFHLPYYHLHCFFHHSYPFSLRLYSPPCPLVRPCYHRLFFLPASFPHLSYHPYPYALPSCPHLFCH